MYILFILTYMVVSSIQLTANEITPPEYGTLTGIVKSVDGELLEGANVYILESNFGTATNRKGEFSFTKLSKGVITLRVTYIGFESFQKRVTIYGDKESNINVILKSKSFTIGTIEVVADDNFIPLEPTTKTVISSGEIEHLQATSLKDILELTPGASKANPNLHSATVATIRGGSSLGTQIIIDGSPISNNVNMQSGIGYTTHNRGIDLRSIPASNIESVEIIHGIPSVKYGDLTDGAIIVKTKAKPVKTKIRAKYNPNISELSGSVGFVFRNTIINNNLNVATSGRDVRIEGDGYTRIALQTNIITQFNNSKLKNSLSFTKTFDERKELPGYALRESWYNRDLILRYNGIFNHNINVAEKLTTTFSLSYTKRNSYKQSLISRDNIVVSDRKSEGTQDGHIVFGSYLGKKWIKGDEWNIYFDLNYSKRLFTGKFLHRLLFGITYRNEFNKGDGIVFNPLYPPSLGARTPRLRTFSELPNLEQISFYIEDKIVGNLFFPFTFVAGLRYDAFNPKSINVEGIYDKTDFLTSKNGTFLNPRLNLSINLLPTTQVRFGYGVTAKAPPLGMIAAQDRYFDIVDTVSVISATDPSQNISVVSTYLREQANPDMKAYLQNKYEISIDQAIGFGGISVTYFRNKTENGFSTFRLPIVLNKYSYPNFPDLTERRVKETIFTAYNQYDNLVTTDNSGFELRFRTKRIPIINTLIRIDARYLDSKRSYNNKHLLGSARFSNELGGRIRPIYETTDKHNIDLKLNYRFDIQAESIGMWMTLHIEQKAINFNGGKKYDDRYAIAYFTENSEIIKIDENERKFTKYEFLKRRIEDFELLDEDFPQLFNLNLVVSKSLWKGAAISFFVNNFFSHQPFHRLIRSPETNPIYVKRNIPIFYGMEFHTLL